MLPTGEGEIKQREEVSTIGHLAPMAGASTGYRDAFARRVRGGSGDMNAINEERLFILLTRLKLTGIRDNLLDTASREELSY